MTEITNVTRSEFRARNEAVDARLDSFNERLTQLERYIKRILDIVEAWDNAKGFINVVRAISATLKILAWPVAFLIALWYLFTTGHLPPK